MLNLVLEKWIPVRLRNGTSAKIAPWQVVNPDVMFPNWKRADFNLACLELLIGLVYLAFPPERSSHRRPDRRPDEAALRDAMLQFVDAFHLTGDGPKFLQDFDGFNGGSVNSPDMLFIDSAGDSTIKKNQDVMVHGNRYEKLDFATAAMALYTLQNFAPSGGAGNRTSMRGGGPMVTLIIPENANLSDIIWANVPIGAPLPADQVAALPWMRPILATDPKADWPDPLATADHVNPEVFFGQPRRITLITDGNNVTGVKQTPWGNNYVGWRHPLSPYYQVKDEWLPKHPKPGGLTYAAWFGTVYEENGTQSAPRVREAQRGRDPYKVLVGGWAMSNMSPQDFIWAEVPVWGLDDVQLSCVKQMIDGGIFVARMLAGAIGRAMGDADASGQGDRARAAFYQSTEPMLVDLIKALVSGGDPVQIRDRWLQTALKSVAIKLFQDSAMPRVTQVSGTKQREIVDAGKSLHLMLRGIGKSGANLFAALDLPQPEKKAKAA